MPKKISDRAVAKCPAFADRVSLFKSKLQITNHAAGTISDYCHALYKAVLHTGRLPEEMSQQELDAYLAYLLSREPKPSESQFKHFVYGMRSYLGAMGFKESASLSMPRIRRAKRLPRVLSIEDVRRLLRICPLYQKALFSTIYDCGLRSFEACGLRWNDIDFNRRMVHVKKGKGNRDRVVPISYKTLVVLRHYRRDYPSKDYVFKRFGKDAPVDNYIVRRHLKEFLRHAGLDDTLTVHSLRHSYATHLLECGEDIQTVMQRLGHRSVQTTMVYLHVARIDRHNAIPLVDYIFDHEAKV